MTEICYWWLPNLWSDEIMAPNSFILLEQFLTKQVITKVATNQLPDSRNQYQKKPTSGGEDDMVPNSLILPPRAVLTRENQQPDSRNR